MFSRQDVTPSSVLQEQTNMTSTERVNIHDDNVTNNVNSINSTDSGSIRDWESQIQMRVSI